MEVEEGRVAAAYVAGEMFRGFERILAGRDPLDAQHITQRICGVCPIDHGMASVLAQDMAYRLAPPDNGRIIRNLMQAANFIASHVTHFYLLSALDFVDVATGSLVQGLGAGVGMALAARLDKRDYHVWAMLGDGESAEGSVWEAAAMTNFYKLGNLTAIVDINRLGQSQATMLQYDMDTYKKRWAAFGWKPLIIDGHDMAQIVSALRKARKATDQPVAILAKTIKGKGVSFCEDKDGWHGRALKKGEELDKALAE